MSVLAMAVLAALGAWHQQRQVVARTGELRVVPVAIPAQAGRATADRRHWLLAIGDR